MTNYVLKTVSGNQYKCVTDTKCKNEEDTLYLITNLVNHVTEDGKSIPNEAVEWISLVDTCHL